jgi:hypothetical protein
MLQTTAERRVRRVHRLEVPLQPWRAGNGMKVALQEQSSNLPAMPGMVGAAA